MALGMLVNINASLDFDTAEILVADFNKTLKKKVLWMRLILKN